MLNKRINIKNDYKLNITNKNAQKLYEQAGILNPQKGFEISPHIKNATLMQTKNCLRKLTGTCLKTCNHKKDLYLEEPCQPNF